MMRPRSITRAPGGSLSTRTVGLSGVGGVGAGLLTAVGVSGVAGGAWPAGARASDGAAGAAGGGAVGFWGETTTTLAGAVPLTGLGGAAPWDPGGEAVPPGGARAPRSSCTLTMIPAQPRRAKRLAIRSHLTPL